MDPLRLYAAGVVMLAFAAGAQDPSRVILMKVDGLVCAFCAQGVSKSFGKLDATQDVLVNLEQGLVVVALKPGKDLEDDFLRQTLLQAGLTLRTVERKSETLESVRAGLGKES